MMPPDVAAERLPAADLARVRGRERVLLAQIERVKAPRTAGVVIILTELAPPVGLRWADLQTALEFVGLDVHPETGGRVRALLRRGHVPVLTVIDGWVNVHSARSAFLSIGGDA